MNVNKLTDAITGIDPSFIEEASYETNTAGLDHIIKMRKIRRAKRIRTALTVIPMAACVILVVGLVITKNPLMGANFAAETAATCAEPQNAFQSKTETAFAPMEEDEAAFEAEAATEAEAAPEAAAEVEADTETVIEGEAAAEAEAAPEAAAEAEADTAAEGEPTRNTIAASTTKSIAGGETDSLFKIDPEDFTHQGVNVEFKEGRLTISIENDGYNNSVFTDGIDETDLALYSAGRYDWINVESASADNLQITLDSSDDETVIMIDLTGVNLEPGVYKLHISNEEFLFEVD